MFVLDGINSEHNQEGSEDKICGGDNWACVIDGATSIERISYKNYNSLAQGMSISLGNYISDNINKSNFSMLCEKYIEETSHLSIICDTPLKYLPCAVSSFVKLEKNYIVGEYIGDCSAYILKKNNEVCSYIDDRIYKFSQKTLNAILKSSNEYKEEASKKQRIENKKGLNTNEGYFAIAYQGNFANQFKHYKFNKVDVGRILLCSDGFNRAFNPPFSICNVEDILKGELSLKDCVELLRVKEKISCFEEIKIHDDAAAVLIEV